MYISWENVRVFFRTFCKSAHTNKRTNDCGIDRDGVYEMVIHGDFFLEIIRKTWYLIILNVSTLLLLLCTHVYIVHASLHLHVCVVLCCPFVSQSYSISLR